MMKTVYKYLTITILFFSALPLVKAQMSDGGARFGLKLGITGSRFYDYAPATGLKQYTGIVGGGFAKIRLTKHFSLRPELLFAMRGGEVGYNNPSANLSKTELKLNYLELPLSLEFNLLSFLNIHSGVHGGLLVSQDGKFRDKQGNVVGFDLNRDDLHNFDYGWHIGAGIDLGNLGLHVRFLRGLQEIDKSIAFDPFVGNLKNSAWEFTVSYALK